MFPVVSRITGMAYYGESSQVVLMSGEGFWAMSKKLDAVFRDTRIIPAYFVALSIIILLLHIIIVSKPVRSLLARSKGYELAVETEDVPEIQPSSLWGGVKQHVIVHGGWSRFGFMIGRLVGCLALLGISTVTLVLEEEKKAQNGQVGILGKWKKKRKGKKSHLDSFTAQEWLDVAMCATFLYTSLLALVSVSAKRRSSRIVTRHVNTILFATFCVYAYRDLFPLATYDKTPLDIAEGWRLWFNVVALTIAGIVVPLFIPRQYDPVDPKNPFPEPSPDQTASIFSLMVYTFVDPVIYKAYRIPHLPFDELPPLGDTDAAGHLKRTAFKHLDVFTGASKRRHIFFGLMKVFRKEYIFLSIILIFQVIASFASPIGIYQLLAYLENHGRDASIRPWVWISWLFLGPLIASTSVQFYIFLTTRTLVRAEAILTQLVFEHSLRIRVKAEAPEGANKETSSASSSAAPSPDTSSVAEGSDEGTLHSSAATETETVQGSTSSDNKEEEVPKHADSSNLVGKINNLVTTDLENIVDGRDFLFVVLYSPLQLIFCVAFLYAILGWSAFVGLAVIILMIPAPGLVARQVQKVQEHRLKKTDARVQNVTETMNVLRMVKLFGWERRMGERIAGKRKEELVWIQWKMMMDLLNGTLNFLIPVITMIATYATYTVIMKEQLNASKVFSSMSVFDLLREQLHTAFRTVTDAMTAKVSIDRMNAFLHDTELLDQYSEEKNAEVALVVSPGGQDIGFKNATFSWSNDDHDGSLTPSKRRFRLKIDDELKFLTGCINLIIGATGSGKTSLLMALLGEMHFIPNSPDSWCNLPREGGVAYAAQESWVQNETIRENIVFGAPYDEVRYKKVLYQCGLERDITLFEAGDQTEVGEKGLTLSGGQKARITLARAVYSQAEIILLDDVLAALDVHTSKWIVEKCFKGDLIQERTVILVTHNVAIVQPVASFVVSIHDGRVFSQGTVLEVLSSDTEMASEAQKEQEALAKADEEICPPEEEKSDGKLIVAEEVEVGHVSWAALKLYLNGLAGNRPALFFVTWIGGFFLSQVLNTYQTWYLGYWGSQYEDHDPADVKVFYYLGVYGSLLLLGVVVYTLAYFAYVKGAMRASYAIHKRLVESVLGTTLRWLDTTPTSRVIARCTQDIRAVDGPVALYLSILVEFSLVMITKLMAVVIITPVFLGPGILVAILGGICGQFYMKAQLSVKREMSNAKAPVLGHFGAAMAGLTSIRAYGVEESFKEKSISRINNFTRAARTFYNLNRWVCVRIDALGGLFAAALAVYLVYFDRRMASTTGFSLNMAVGFSSLILWWVRFLNEFEVQGNSLERIEHYVNIEQEPKPTASGEPPAYWPASGEITAENLSARYSPAGPKVLHDVSFSIKSGERVGVVGRTGSGKSSLTLSLLRCIFTDGEVYFDGQKTSALNLDALRSNITIIPQIPELLSGTLRQNLDPFDQHDDATLNDALRAAGLFSLQDSLDEGRITLDSVISSGGGNLSVGQRQILALARAIVRRSKLLILDEATSAIDYKTDTVIQSSLRSQLGGDVTLITVAHRLQTIMDADKIMVLDAGRVVEFDSPKELLKNEKGRLRALVDESADKETLYAMVESKASH